MLVHCKQSPGGSLQLPSRSHQIWVVTAEYLWRCNGDADGGGQGPAQLLHRPKISRWC